MLVIPSERTLVNAPLMVLRTPVSKCEAGEIRYAPAASNARYGLKPGSPVVLKTYGPNGASAENVSLYVSDGRVVNAGNA